MFRELDDLNNQKNHLYNQLNVLENSASIKACNLQKDRAGYSDKTIVDFINSKDKISKRIIALNLKIINIQECFIVLKPLELKVLQSLYSSQRIPVKLLEYSDEIPMSRSAIYRMKDEALKKIYDYYRDK